MGGMGSTLETNDPTILSAFRTALVHQGLLIAILFAVAILIWNIVRFSRGTNVNAVQRATFLEPAARRILRYSFGAIWIFDGFLQAQPSMPLGMVPGVVQPTASVSPVWVQHIVSFGTDLWARQPIALPVAAVWIQVGIGLLLLFAPRGWLSRGAGVISALWAFSVWIFGESFGGIFAPGQSFLFGAPGAVVFYLAAGVLIALDDRVWEKRIGRVILAGCGSMLLGYAVLQAWPGRGFWQGATASSRYGGALADMANSMASVPQPRVFRSFASSFANFDARHGFAVNIIVVLVMLAGGAGLCFARGRLLLVSVVAVIVFCLLDWVFVQDIGFFGGVGTDPNSMVPFSLLVAAGYVAVVRKPVRAEEPVPIGEAPSARRAPVWSTSSGLLALLLTSVALITVLFGTVPTVLDAATKRADPILDLATNGPPDIASEPAPPFLLTDQNGAPISLHTLRGKTIALTFLDPVCVSDCPILAQEFRQADELLGATASNVVMVAIAANPVTYARPFLVAFNHQEHLDQLHNWYFATGSLAQLKAIWADFGIQIQPSIGGSMVIHSDLAWVIDKKGWTQALLNADPGLGTAATKASFAQVLADTITKVANQ